MENPLKTVKVPIGLRKAYFGLITEEPEGAHPTYDVPVNMGGNVKAALSVTTASGEIHADDVSQLDFETFVKAQLDAETACDDLELNAMIFGHSFSEENGELSGGDDLASLGGYAFIQDILLKNKTHKYRAIFLFKVSAMPSSEKLDAQTRAGSFDPKMNVISYSVHLDNASKWRWRKEFTSQAAAEEWIMSVFKGTATVIAQTAQKVAAAK